MLKRRFEVGGYENLFDGTFGYKVGEIDPFLIRVLERNKASHQLTDIIKSIQANQNIIIRQDLKENIIVQGCAGSGKTMVLLHRLSTLIYNNPNMPMSSFTIITPNKLFDMHINDLAKRLELGKVARKTMEDIYLTVAEISDSRFSSEVQVLSDRLADQELVSFVYSERFLCSLHGKKKDNLQMGSTRKNHYDSTCR